VFAVKWITGSSIGAFYLIVVVFSIVCLATSQFRSSSGSAFDTWRLNYDANLVRTREHEKTLETLRKDPDTKNYWDNLIFTKKCLLLYDDKSGVLKSPADPDTLKRVRTAKDNKILYEDSKSLPYDDVRCIFRGFTMLQWDQEYYDKLNKDREQEILNVQNLLKADEEEHADLIKGRQEFSALKEMEKKWYTRLLVDIPYDLLVLFLVMSMGLLGGIIRILRDYGDADRTNPSIKDYFLVPLIGAVVAIGGYILAKTGLLLLSSTKGETSLSPFMVGIVGMVSGLLAKEVVDRIAAYGRDVLKKKNEG
jgi:hypothetical protein